jgi:2-polyprenyl-3-methyl-5-hydroxy-6-metoxy-1,4-benzoquinol methylase
MPRDVFRFIDDLDDEAINRIAARLEFRGTDPGYVAFREAYFAKLPLGTAQRVLALGCGTGIEVRALKRRPEFAGEVLGIDLSPRLIEEAQRLTATEGLANGVAYQSGDAHALDVAGASFDIVLAHTLLSHVTDPSTVLREACRVVAPGGMVAIFDGDYASLTFTHPDPELAERVEKALLELLVNNPRVLRDLPRLLREAGLELVEATAHAYADVGAGGFFANLAEAVAALLTNAGVLPADEIARWRDWQAQAVAEGVFFGASNDYTFLARRPVGTVAA